MNNLSTYFVETHEYNFETGNCDLLEYFAYGSEYFQGVAEIHPPTHHTILTLALI